MKVPINCSLCYASGELRGQQCPACGGSGKVFVDHCPSCGSRSPTPSNDCMNGYHAAWRKVKL